MNHQRLRKALLLEVHRRTGGDVTRAVTVGDAGRALGVSEDAVVVAAHQLAEKGTIRAEQGEYDLGLVLRITWRGVEEAERMEEPFLQRFAHEHPVLLAWLSSVVGGLTVLLGSRLVDKLF